MTPKLYIRRTGFDWNANRIAPLLRCAGKVDVFTAEIGLTRPGLRLQGIARRIHAEGHLLTQITWQRHATFQVVMLCLVAQPHIDMREAQCDGIAAQVAPVHGTVIDLPLQLSKQPLRCGRGIHWRVSGGMP